MFITSNFFLHFKISLIGFPLWKKEDSIAGFVCFLGLLTHCDTLLHSVLACHGGFLFVSAVGPQANNLQSSCKSRFEGGIEMGAKKKTLTELDAGEKSNVKKIVAAVFITVALSCVIAVGCLSCSIDYPIHQKQTDEQKVQYWQSKISDVLWFPMTDALNDGILKGLPNSMDVWTSTDDGKSFYLNFIRQKEKNYNNYWLQAIIELVSESGMLIFMDEMEPWQVKFSEKNNKMCMTIIDSDGKKVFFENKGSLNNI